LHPERRERRVKEAPRRAVGSDDAALVGGVRKVAARAPGHEDFHAGLTVLLQEQHASAVLGGADRGHQPRRTRAGDHNVEHRMSCGAGLVSSSTVYGIGAQYAASSYTGLRLYMWSSTMSSGYVLVPLMTLGSISPTSAAAVTTISAHSQRSRSK